jgi:AcrR family transcriptional regulator
LKTSLIEDAMVVEESLVRRGRPPVLSLDQLCSAATRVADRDGLAACTVRTIAAELGASPMSVYRYVDEKDALLGLLPDFLLRDVSVRVRRRKTAETALGEVADGVGELLSSHPELAPLFARPNIGPSMQAAADHCVQLLTSRGWPAGEAVELLQAIVAQVIGEHLTRREDDEDNRLHTQQGLVRQRSWGVGLMLRAISQGPISR